MKRIFLFVLLSCSWAVPLFAQDPDTLHLLQELIRIDTSNPPGNETSAAYLVHALLARNGIFSEVIESAPGRGNLIARLKGDGSKPAMILLGHLDVVPADPTEWQIPPFSGEIKDGEIWGRGSLDMKGMVAMETEAFLRLKSQHVPLGGDVILVLTADEEAGGREGAEFLVKNHWDKIEAKYLLTEGSVGIRKDGMNVYAIQVAEKGVAWMKITAHGTSGHGSMPEEDNAVVRLAEAVEKLAHHRFPVIKTDVLAAFLERLSGQLPFYQRLGIRLFFAPVIGPVIQRIAAHTLAKEKSIRAVLSDTISPTMLSAGYKVNVIPAEASAAIDARILPGETPGEFLEKVRKMLGAGFDVELITGSVPNKSDFQTDYFRTVEEALRKADGSAITAPIISAGATDSRFFREKGVTCYGIIPLLLTPEQVQGLHGKNERIPVDQLERGTGIVYDVVKRMQALP